jgi:hypothetical protein
MNGCIRRFLAALVERYGRLEVDRQPLGRVVIRCGSEKRLTYNGMCLLGRAWVHETYGRVGTGRLASNLGALAHASLVS